MTLLEVWMCNPWIALTIQQLEAWQRASSLPPSDLEGVVFFCDARELRSRWLADLSQALDSYMRSPAFLELMQQNFKAMTRPTDHISPPNR
jgi:hypothetical protein